MNICTAGSKILHLKSFHFRFDLFIMMYIIIFDLNEWNKQIHLNMLLKTFLYFQVEIRFWMNDFPTGLRLLDSKRNTDSTDMV